MISKGFGLVAFFASVKSSSICIHLSCPVCIQSVVHGVRSRLFCGHKGCSLLEVSLTSFLPLQFFFPVGLSRVQFSDPYKNVGITKVLYIVSVHTFLKIVLLVVRINCKKVANLTLRRLMSYICMEHPFLMFLDHTQRRSTVGRTPLDE